MRLYREGGSGGSFICGSLGYFNASKSFWHLASASPIELGESQSLVAIDPTATFDQVSGG